jgi:hypothetical protein
LHWSSIYGSLKAVKTTLDISKETLRQVKSVAAREGVPMREVFERGMRAYIAGAVPSKPFRLRTITTKGQGLAKPREWAEIRELIYAGQGGDRK